MATDIEKIRNFAHSYQADKNNKIHSYEFADPRLTIEIAGYFNPVRDNHKHIKLSDLIIVRASDGDGLYYVTAIQPDVTLHRCCGGEPPTGPI